MGLAGENPGPGGYSAILIFGEQRKEVTGGCRWTTNNRMEITAVIEGVLALKRGCEVEVHSDSRYVIDTIEKGWIFGWKKRGWVTAARQPVKNRDLWEKLDHALRPHRVSFAWVKGHAGSKNNNRCDELAVAAAEKYRHHIDEVFEIERPFVAQV